MAIQITIVGLGQIGTSVGLALANEKERIVRVGHDREIKVGQQAQKMGALDRYSHNLPNAIENADIVLLSLPADQVRDTISLIAQDLKSGAVVMDTAPVKEKVAGWAKELLPEGCHYVGLTPVINPLYLHMHESGIEGAHADLFRAALIAIVSPPNTPSEAVKLAADLIRLLGSTPLFAEPVEVDSLMAATHILPQLLAAALLNITVDQPGWREGRKLAGRAYAEVTGPMVQLGSAGAISASAMLAGENLVRAIDSVMASLNTLKNDIKNEDAAALTERLERAREGRERWWIQRQKGDWLGEDAAAAVGSMASGSDSSMFGRLLGMNRKPKDKK